jgi:geranylgeranyl reductase family protein
MQCDAVIVGAGPAGSTTARELRERIGPGARVLLVDRATFPRDKPCGGGITTRTASLLPFSIDPVVEDVIHGARIRLRDGRDVRRESDRALTLMTQRSRLDHFLVERAEEAGVEFRDGTAIRGAERLHDGSFRLRTDADTLSTRVLIGADGANGVIRTFLGYEHPASSAVALEGNIHFRNGPPEEFRGVVSLNMGLLPGGYAWVFPKGDHVNVGVGGWKGSMGKRLRPALSRICELYGLDPSALVNVRGHHLPMQRPGAVIAAGGSALVGDAGGLVDPLSGEGIHAAIVSGIAAGRAGADLVTGAADSMRPYQDAIETQLGPELAASRAFMHIFHASPAPFVWAMQRSDWVWRRCCDLLLGERSYEDTAHTFGRVGAALLQPTARLAARRNAARAGAARHVAAG